MLKNYFKTAWRNFRKNKTFSLINVAGLSVGISCFLLIALYVLDEFSYDRYNRNAGRICRIDNHIQFGDFHYDGTEISAIAGPAFSRSLPQIERYTRLKKHEDIVLRKRSGHIREEKAAFADSSLFDVFTLSMLAGDPHTALTRPGTVVITESIARKYFNGIDVVGKSLPTDENQHYIITGVIRDMPRTSHFHFNFFFPMCDLDQSRETNWFNNNFITYLLLKPGTDIHRLQAELNRTMMADAAPQFENTLSMSRQDFEKNGNYIRCSLLPLTAIHLHSQVADELEPNSDIRYVYIFSMIALFILLIACVNFMNLSTAHSANRAREVGVRKVLGGLRSNLVLQFLTESVLISLLSFIVAMGLALLALPYFNRLAGKTIDPAVLQEPGILAGLFGLMLAVGLVAGSYPGFILSSFRPVEVLKGRIAGGFKSPFIRNALVVFQFTISMVLIIGTMVIFRQLNYIRHKNLGFDKDQVLVLPDTYGLDTRAFRSGLLRMPGVESVTVTGYLPVKGARGDRGFTNSPVFDGKNFAIMQQWPVDEAYIPTLGLHLLDGRNFSGDTPTDSDAVILNEAAAKILGSGSPLHKELYRIADLKTRKLVPYHVIGVVRNFNFNSLHEAITPLVLKLAPDNGSIAIKTTTHNMQDLLTKIKARWQALAPAQPFNYFFLDETFNQQYKTEQRTGTISLLFAVLAIFIACLGLYGLITYAAEQRVKEIGIRKVLGAAVPDIIGMLSKDFLKPILLALCLAWPIAWWSMHWWLQDFAYRTPVAWWIFAGAGGLVLVIALATAGFQTLRAALANPVDSLRSE